MHKANYILFFTLINNLKHKVSFFIPFYIKYMIRENFLYYSIKLNVSWFLQHYHEVIKCFMNAYVHVCCFYCFLNLIYTICFTHDFNI